MRKKHSFSKVGERFPNFVSKGKGKVLYEKKQTRKKRKKEQGEERGTPHKNEGGKRMRPGLLRKSGKIYMITSKHQFKKNGTRLRSGGIDQL